MQIISESQQRFTNTRFDDEVSIKANYLTFSGCDFLGMVTLEGLNIYFIGCRFKSMPIYDSKKETEIIFDRCYFEGGDFRMNQSVSVKFENEAVIADAFTEYIKTIDMSGLDET